MFSFLYWFGHSPRVLESCPVPLSVEASEYERLARSNEGRFSRSFVRLVSQVGMKHARVLDIGTGPGLIPVALALEHPGWECWGVDPSDEMLQPVRN
jgi:ubiquinone/menaquinone biosynthesis C-methylase UbiE